MALHLGPLHQVSQPVKDLDRAVSFYGEVLGLRLIARPGPLAFFDLDGVRLYMQAPGDGGDVGGAVLYLAVDDIDGARRELGDRGVVFEQEPHLIFDDADGTFGPAGAEHWMAFFRDSEGNLVALSEIRRSGG
jgi:methylmalonyl-CoA/ethylmalonyl-CoA epimerase